MNEERMTILRMVAEKKISTEEAARLLEALEEAERAEAGEAFGGDTQDRPHADRPGRRHWKFRYKHRHRPADWQERLSDLSKDLSEMVSGIVHDSLSKKTGVFGEHGVFGRHGVFGHACGKEEPSGVSEIAVPEGSEVRIRCLGGNLTVRGVEGDHIRFPSRAGWSGFPFRNPRISVNEEERRVEVSLFAGNGDLEIPWRVVRLKAHATGGNLSLTDVSADCDLQVEGGNLSLGQVTGAIQALVNGGNAEMNEITSNRVEVRVNGGMAALHLRTLTEGQVTMAADGGDVHLHLPADSAFTLAAQTRAGQISANIPGTHESDELGINEAFHAIYRDGGASITLSAHAGQIDIAVE
jgi:DUF4097 and DUF4098 domain-containing protein YvlB